MKIKIFATLIAVIGFSSISYATAIPAAGTSLGTNAPTSFKPSSKVGINAIATASNYAASAQHASATGNAGAKGGFQYGTTDTLGSIQRAPATATAIDASGCGVPTAPTSATALDSAFVNF